MHQLISPIFRLKTQPNKNGFTGLASAIALPIL